MLARACALLPSIHDSVVALVVASVYLEGLAWGSISHTRVTNGTHWFSLKDILYITKRQLFLDTEYSENRHITE